MFVTFSKDKVMNFKKYLYAFAAVLMTVIAPSCVKDGYGEPMISTDKSTYEIPLEGGEVKVMLTSTRSWIARVFPATSLDDIEGIVVEPASGKASSEPIEVTIKATANASYPRAALISFETSVVSAAVTVNQDGPVARPAAELTVAEFLKKEVDASIYYKLTGTIKNLKNTEYGNFDLVDETGSVYVYGLTTEKQASNDKSFSQLGLKEGDVLTLEGTRAAYNGSPQVGGPAYYISHEAGDAPAAPGPKAMTIAAAVAQTDSVLVSGTVMALCARGFILQDESGVAFIYDTNYSQTYSVGDQVKVGGKPGAYNYANQITPNAKYYEKTGSVEVTYPDPVVLNAAKVAEMKDGAGADKNVGVYDPFYITVEGTVRVSGNYFNLDIDGVETSTAQGSFYQLTDAQKEELTALKDKAVVLTGYFQSISQSGGVPKFFNVIYLTVEEKEAEGGEEPSEKAARNLAFSSATATATLGQDFTAPTLSGVTDGVEYSSSNTAVATVDDETGAVTIVAAGQTTITAAAEETETLQAGTASYTLTVSAEEVTPSEPILADGKYWIVGTKGGVTKVMTPLAADKAHGYPASEALVNNTSYLENAFTFTAVAGGYTIQDQQGRYYFNESNYKTFNAGTDGTLAACVWTIAKGEDNTYTIVNNETGKQVLYADGTYTSFGVYGANDANSAVAITLMDASGATARPVLNIANSSAAVDAETTTHTIELESNLAWTATATEGVTLSPASGNGNASVVMTFAANTGEAALTYTVTFTAGDLTKTFTLTHKAPANGGQSTDPVTLSIKIEDLVKENNYTVSAGQTVTNYKNLSLDSVISMVAGGSATNEGSFWDSGKQWRIYQTGGGKVTVSAIDGYTIQSVKFTYTVSKTGILKTTSGNLESGTVDTVNSSSVTYTVGNTGSATNGQVRITDVEVVYQAN